MKKNTPKKKFIHAIVIHFPFLSIYYGVANFLKPKITNRLGMKNPRPLPANVAMTPKMDGIGRPNVEMYTSTR